MSCGPFACQNPHPRREIRASLIITWSVLTHQRKKLAQSIYISCTSRPWYICLERWAIMLETVTKFPSSHWYNIYLRKMPSWQWEKPSFSWQGPSRAYSFRLHLSNMPRFPNWSHPKMSLCALGLLPTANLRGPTMAVALQGVTLPWGRALCHQQPQHWWSLQGIHKLLWPRSPAVHKETKEGTDSVPLLPSPAPGTSRGEDSEEPTACPGLPLHSRPEVCTCLSILRTTWLPHAASLLSACRAEVEVRRHCACQKVGCMCVLNW